MSISWRVLALRIAGSMDNNLLDKLMQDTWGQFRNFRIPFYNGEKPFHIGTFAFLCFDFTTEDSR